MILVCEYDGNNSIDTVYTVIRLLFDKNHEICEASSIDSVAIKVYTSTQLDSLHSDHLSESLYINSSISGSAWDDWTQNIGVDSLDYIIDEDAFIIDFNNDSLLVDRWCKNDSSYDILISYSNSNTFYLNSSLIIFLKLFIFY